MTLTAQPNTREIIVWEAQPGPQEALIACPIEDVLYGGARGGGKTDGLLGDWISHADEYGQYARGIFFRRSYPELEEVERRASELFAPLGARLNVQRRTWVWPNGASLRMRYLDRDKDADSYQGHSYTFLAVDELTQFASLTPIDKLRACLRSAQGVPCVFRASANPGGPGHNLVKARYIDPAPPWVPFTAEHPLPDGTIAVVHRVFIPATLDDNQILIQHDPQYWQRVVMAASGREDLLKAWRYGLWDIVAGGMFDDLWQPEIHAISPFLIPSAWRVYRAFDWGSSHPFSVGWWAKSDGTTAPNGRTYPRGTLFRIGEWYGCVPDRPNEGLRMLAVDVAKGILAREVIMNYAINPGPADSSIYDEENGNCIARDMAKAKLDPDTGRRVTFQRADKSPGSRHVGWEAFRRMLKASTQRPMEDPGLFVFNTCRDFIRLIPTLPRDARDSDDLDSSSEDHIADESRYMVTWTPPVIEMQKLVGV
jgi:hypothetical protein